MFDISPVITQCRAYINAIDDYKIEVRGKTVITEDVIRQYGATESVKVLLMEFIFECKEESMKGEYSFIKFLRNKRENWRIIQAETIGKINANIEQSVGERKKTLEEQVERFLSYFHHNYTIIDLMIARLTDTPLDDFVKFKLKRVGLDWLMGNIIPIGPQEMILPSALEEKSKFRDQPPPSLLYLKHEAKQTLYNSIVNYFDEADLSDLHNLIFKNIPPTNSLVVTCQVKEFAYSFKKAVPAKGAPTLSKQLPKYFLRNEGDMIVNFSSSMLARIMGEKEK